MGSEGGGWMQRRQGLACSVVGFGTGCVELPDNIEATLILKYFKSTAMYRFCIIHTSYSGYFYGAPHLRTCTAGNDELKGPSPHF